MPGSPAGNVMELSFSLGSARTVTPELEILLRLVLAASFGGVIGLEREIKDRAAGLRTHMMTALAAAVFTVLTLEIYQHLKSVDETVRADPIRIVEAVTAGVAFLAAGAIIHGRGKIRGLTTGAGMWLAGAVGLACGAGYYVIAIMATVLAVIILAGLKAVERWFQ